MIQKFGSSLVVLVVKNPPANAGDAKDMDFFFPGSERSPGERKWQSTPVFLLGNPMDRGAWQATVHRVVKVRHDIATKQQQQHTPQIKSRN